MLSEPRLLIKGEQALLFIWGFRCSSSRAEAALLPVWEDLGLTP